MINFCSIVHSNRKGNSGRQELQCLSLKIQRHSHLQLIGNHQFPKLHGLSKQLCRLTDQKVAHNELDCCFLNEEYSFRAGYSLSYKTRVNQKKKSVLREMFVCRHIFEVC